MTPHPEESLARSLVEDVLVGGAEISPMNEEEADEVTGRHQLTQGRLPWVQKMVVDRTRRLRHMSSINQTITGGNVICRNIGIINYVLSTFIRTPCMETRPSKIGQLENPWSS